MRQALKKLGAALDWLSDLTWNILYPPSIWTESSEHDRLERLRYTGPMAAEMRWGIALMALVVAGFPLPFVIGTIAFKGLEPASPWFIGYAAWLAFIVAVHIYRNIREYLLGLAKVAGYILYPAGAAQAITAAGTACRRHKDVSCWRCLLTASVGIGAIWALAIASIVVLYGHGISSTAMKPFIAWHGILALGTLWFFRKRVLDLLDWLFLRACRILYPPLCLYNQPEADAPCGLHAKEGCGRCSFAAFVDIMGCATVLLTGLFVLGTYGLDVRAMPFMAWAAIGLFLPICTGIYRWADELATRSAAAEVQQAAEQAGPRPEAPLPQPSFAEMSGPSGEPPVPAAHSPLLDDIARTTPEAAAMGRLAELRDRVVAFEAEQNGGRPVDELREALSTLEQMANVAQMKS